MPMNPITHFESSTDRGNCLFAAMVAADNNGYIHRDISPTNIILYRTPGDPMDKPRRGVLCDWDLSRVRGESTLLDDYEVSVRAPVIISRCHRLTMYVTTGYMAVPVHRHP